MNAARSAIGRNLDRGPRTQKKFFAARIFASRGVARSAGRIHAADHTMGLNCRDCT
jgi:hypothetical protein